MSIRKLLLAFAGAAIVGALVDPSAHAWTISENYLTFNAPVALPGVTLRAGTYTFRTPSDNNKDVVQVLNRAQTQSYYIGITRPVERPRRGSSAVMVTIGEAPVGQVRPIQVWFPVGETAGHEFIYDR